MNLSALVGCMRLTVSFLTNGLVTASATSETAAKITHCSQTGAEQRLAMSAASEPRANQTVVSCTVTASATMNAISSAIHSTSIVPSVVESISAPLLTLFDTARSLKIHPFTL